MNETNCDFPLDEAKRLDILQQYDVMDTLPEEALDDLTALAGQICAAPIAAISLVAKTRQWFKARKGLEEAESCRSASFCAHGLGQKELLVVEDTTRDVRFASNRLVTAEHGIRFYAGAPLISPEGAVLGMLCVMDRVPRTLAGEQKQALGVLSRQVMTHLNLRRQARELGDRERLLRAIFDAEPECVKLLSANGRLQLMNHAGLEMIEADSLEQVAGNSVLPLIGASDRAAFSSLTGKVFEGQTGRLEFGIVGLKGTERCMDVHAAPLRDESGVVTAMLGVSRDITERKQAEAHLRLLEMCVARLNDMVFITEAGPLEEPGPRILFVNDAVARLTGYARAEVVGRSPRFLQGPKTCPAELDRIYAALREHRRVRAELINYRKSGEEFWIEIDVVPVEDASGTVTHLVAVERDITERKRAEARFRWLADSNAQGVAFWKADGEVTGGNDAFLRLVGYSRQDLQEGRINLAELTAPEYADAHRRSRAEIAASGVCTPHEKEYIRKDGSRVPLLIGGASFEDNPEEGVSFLLDLTDRKKLELQFLRAQRMECIGTLAGGIAHDLNNALGPIITSIELLQMQFPNAASQELLAIIAASAKRGADMVRQVLSFARGVEGRRMEVQIKHLVLEIERIVRDTFPKHIQVRTIVPHHLWTVLGDPTQLHQVLLNLCVNARDAMPHGGTLTISGENLQLDEHYAALFPEAVPGSYVMVRVEDSGSGIAPKVLEQIFDPFFTTKEIGQGTGLGLSTSLAIVKSHGGFIRVKSLMGRGTTFEVYLHAPAEAVAAAEAEKAVELPRGHGELILVVDDEIGVREITRRTLENFGYRVLLAAEGAKAVAAFAARRAEIAAVITDMTMPVMDGIATIRVLARDET